MGLFPRKTDKLQHLNGKEQLADKDEQNSQEEQGNLWDTTIHGQEAQASQKRAAGAVAQISLLAPPHCNVWKSGREAGGQKFRTASVESRKLEEGRQFAGHAHWGGPQPACGTRQCPNRQAGQAETRGRDHGRSISIIRQKSKTRKEEKTTWHAT